MAVPQTTLAAAIADGAAVSATVRDVLGFASASEADDVVLIGSEFLHVTAGMGTTTWTVTRGYSGSAAAAHADGSTVTRIERGWTSLLDVKGWQNIPAADMEDDTDLILAIGATNATLDEIVGAFLGPSADTARTLSGRDARCDGRCLWVPGGIRSLGTLEVKATTGAADWEAITAGDVELMPHAQDLRPGEPYSWLEFTDETAGSYSAFPAGYSNVRLTGSTFGWLAVNEVGASIARTCVHRMWNQRGTGALSNPTPSKFLYNDDMALLRALRAEVIPGA